MINAPLLSFIVLSYNYEKYIGQTIRSILNQTVQDFEIVVVDDASSDRSQEVINAFGDPRIRLLVNEKNLGGAGSYNRAVEAARGEWLVNLDADDWIAPEKSQRQLDAIENDPELDIVGTYCRVVDANGDQHPDHERLELYFARKHDLNVLDNWIGHNLLCRSSTMIRREAHLRIGLDDPTMIRAPDYELWTRALRHGCRFRIVPERLTYYRLHMRGVTFGDARGTYLELSYAMLKNLIPLAEDRVKWSSYSLVLTWLIEEEQFAALTPTERYNLLGSIVMRADPINYETFVKDLGKHGPATDLGRRILAFARTNPLLERIDKLSSDATAYVEARDWWQAESERWQTSYAEVRDWREAESKRWQTDRDLWEAESKRWQTDRDLWEAESKRWQTDRDSWEAENKRQQTVPRWKHRAGQLKDQLKKLRAHIVSLRTKWKPLR